MSTFGEGLQKKAQKIADERSAARKDIGRMMRCLGHEIHNGELIEDVNGSPAIEITVKLVTAREWYKSLKYTVGQI